MRSIESTASQTKPRMESRVRGNVQARFGEGDTPYLKRSTVPTLRLDYSRAPDSWCKHRLAHAIAKRAYPVAKTKLEAAQTAPRAASLDPGERKPPAVWPTAIEPQHLVTIQGKPFVKFAGLLKMAHERGLQSLTADWTYNDAELSLAHAIATFADGRRFEEAGDATPANTNRKVAVHFRRVALTRAKARVLRDALGVDLVAVEELADSE